MSSSSEGASVEVGLSFLAALAAEEVLSSRSETRPSFLRVLAKRRLVLALAMRADLIFWAEEEAKRRRKEGGKEGELERREGEEEEELGFWLGNEV